VSSSADLAWTAFLLSIFPGAQNRKGKVFHINGHWNGCHWDAKDSAPVVLSATDYTEFGREEEFTAVLKHMAMTYSLLFIGFGTCTSYSCDKGQRRSYHYSKTRAQVMVSLTPRGQD
jgi:hypothetical protein